MTAPALHGLLVIDKPAGITSRDAVNRAQHWFPRGTRLGHTGTLDPLATGVLVLCVGTATRLAEYVQRMPKTYRAGVVLGAASDTDDADGQITATTGAVPPTRDQFDAALGCGGYIQSLRRTRVGAFDEAQAIPLDLDRDAARARLLPLALAVADLPRLSVGEADARRLQQGQALRLPDGTWEDRTEVAIFGAQDQLLAVAVVDRPQSLLRPEKVIPA